MDWFNSTFDEPVSNALKRAKLTCRPGASSGSWVPFLIPCAVVLGSLVTPETSEQYHVIAVVASGMFGAAAAMLLHLARASKSGDTSLRAFSIAFFVPAGLTAFLLFLHSHRGIAFSLFGGLVSTFPYCMCLPLLLQALPGVFSLGEAAAVVQAAVLFLFSALTNLGGRLATPEAHLDSMAKTTLILQVGVLGLLAVCAAVLVHPTLRETRPFLALMVGVMGGCVVPALCVLLRENPVLWILHFILDDKQRMYLLLYWLVCSGVAVMAVCTQVQGALHASTAVRKTFHLLVLAVYLPGLAWECTFTYLASGIAFAALITVELVRLLRVGWLGDSLQQGFLVFADEKDSGGLALTPLYLLAGCSAPLWLHPARCALRASVALPVLSGLLAVGAGDTAASVVGSAWGATKWPGSLKSIEGTAACFFAQICVLCIISYFGFVPLTWLVAARASVAVFVISLAEALTDQVDNLVLPLLMYIVLLTLL